MHAETKNNTTMIRNLTLYPSEEWIIRDLLKEYIEKNQRDLETFRDTNLPIAIFKQNIDICNAILREMDVAVKETFKNEHKRL